MTKPPDSWGYFPPLDPEKGQDFLLRTARSSSATLRSEDILNICFQLLNN